MRTGISRRVALRGMGQTMAAGTLAAALPRMLRAAEAQAAAAPAPATTYCLTMLYPYRDKDKVFTFDGEAFRNRHLLTLKGAYGDALERVELRMPPPPAPPPAPPAESAPPAEGAAPAPPAAPPPPTPPLLAAVSMWIRDTAEFQKRLAAHQQEVAADMADITTSQPFGQLDKFVMGYGGERSSVVLNSSCLSFYYQARELKDKVEAKWDAKGYVEHYLPKLYEAFGAEAVQRIEVVQGEPRGGRLYMLGAVHIYIGDEQKFMAAGESEALKLLGPEEQKYSNAPPMQTYMLVRAAG